MTDKELYTALREDVAYIRERVDRIAETQAEMKGRNAVWGALMGLVGGAVASYLTSFFLGRKP